MTARIKIFSLILLLAAGAFFAAPRARAMDPVTLALLAPAAMRMAEATHPYLMNGLACGARGLAKTGISAFKILYLPLGAVQCTLGLPFGFSAPDSAIWSRAGRPPSKWRFTPACCRSTSAASTSDYSGISTPERRCAVFPGDPIRLRHRRSGEHDIPQSEFDETVSVVPRRRGAVDRVRFLVEGAGVDAVTLPFSKVVRTEQVAQ